MSKKRTQLIPNKLDYIYGLHAADTLLRRDPKRIQRLWIQQDRQDQRMQAVLALAKHVNMTPQVVTRQFLDELTQDAVHQGIVAQITVLPAYIEDNLLQLLDTIAEPAFLLILDGVQDPHNLGACLRTANAAGVHAVIIPKDKSVALTPVVQKVASGAALVTPLIEVTNLARTLKQLQQRNIWIYGTSDHAEKSIYATDLRGAVGLVFGAEGKGMRRLTHEHCDIVMQIPLHGTVSSLNVAVAAGVCLFEAVRQRG